LNSLVQFLTFEYRQNYSLVRYTQFKWMITDQGVVCVTLLCG